MLADLSSGMSLLIRQGRRANLLGRLAHQLNENDLMAAAVPEQPKSAPDLGVADGRSSRNKAMRWEVLCILKALETPELT